MQLNPETMEELRRVLEAKVSPAFVPLLALVRDECWDCKHGIPIGRGQGEHLGYGGQLCDGSGYFTRTAYWQAAPDSALVLPLYHAAYKGGFRLNNRDLLHMVFHPGSDQAMLEAVLAWAKGEAWPPASTTL